MLQKITILGGCDKDGKHEKVDFFDIEAGEVFAIIGATGSGKTQLISDIEQYIDDCETITGRSILINDLTVDKFDINKSLRHLVAEVSQNMNFVMDMSVKDFLMMHAKVKDVNNPQQIINKVLEMTNLLAGEAVKFEDNLTKLSGGQSRALMVADVALISNAPIVLIDEIENAGINRLKALEILKGQGKITLVVTHDPTLLLMAKKRVVMKNGGMYKIHQTTQKEKEILKTLVSFENNIFELREYMRNGGIIINDEYNFNSEGKSFSSITGR